jgi:hypothetical protein
MRQRALIGALSLVLIGVILGATVFRSDIAQATGLAQSVTVDNTAANPVPVQEQGTLATRHERCAQLVISRELICSFSDPVRASLVTIKLMSSISDASSVTFWKGGPHSSEVVLDFFPVLGGERIILPLTQPILIGGVSIGCSPCSAEVNVNGS